ncbi:uncharacterized protein [Symphalangus syndactylus]|uniref:uncharacterized protein n=1 Tax=Symphalangus syndactylus TaxID=9590 RepID=UPI0030073239
MAASGSGVPARAREGAELGVRTCSPAPGAAGGHWNPPAAALRSADRGRVAAVPAPGNRLPACPGRAPLAALWPSIPAPRRIWQAHRSTARRTGGRGRPARAPPPHAQSRTSPPCAPSPDCAFLPGKEKKVPARPPPLKGAAPPLPPHPPYPSSAFSPKHLSATPKGLDFPSPSLASPRKRRLGSKMDVTGGAGGGICLAAFLRLLLLLKRPARLERPGIGASGNRGPRAAGWNAGLASAALPAGIRRHVGSRNRKLTWMEVEQ